MITLVAGTTGPSLTFSFIRGNAPVDLTGCTVVAYIFKDQQGTTLTKALTVLSPSTAGQAQLVWAEGDLTVGVGQSTDQYLIDFLVTSTFNEVQPRQFVLTVRAGVSTF
jgi:hypothetical protein